MKFRWCGMLAVVLLSGQIRAQQTLPTSAGRNAVAQSDTVVRAQSRQVKTEVKAQVQQTRQDIQRTGAGNGMKPSTDQPRQHVEQVKQASATAAKTTEQDVKQAPAAVKTEVQATRQQAKKLQSTNGEQLLDQHADKLQYDSQHPDAKPWEQLPGQAADALKRPRPAVALPDARSRGEGVLQQAKALPDTKVNAKDPRQAITRRVPDLKSLQRVADSVRLLRDKDRQDQLQGLLTGSRKLYSDQYKQKLYDSLGLDKGDSLLGVVRPLLKTETPKSTLIDRINQNMTMPPGVKLNADQQSLNVADASKLQALEQPHLRDLTKAALPDSVLTGLRPLGGRLTTNRYARMADSLREVTLRHRRQQLDREDVSEGVTRVVMKKKPRFVDKLYFDGIIGFANDSTIKLVQLSPTLGYHLTPVLSIGAGPSVLLQIQQRKTEALLGMRSYIKAEVWKQRAYLQVEDNVNQTKLSQENLRMPGHRVLAGGGVLLPLSSRIAFNVSVLRRIYADTHSGSPWVFRIGLSSIKPVNPK